MCNIFVSFVSLQLEQDLATKEDADGNKIKKIADYVAQLTPIFQVGLTITPFLSLEGVYDI